MMTSTAHQVPTSVVVVMTMTVEENVTVVASNGANAAWRKVSSTMRTT